MDNYIYILGQSGSGKKKFSNEMAILEPVTRKRAPPPLPGNKELSKAMASPAPIKKSRAPPPLSKNEELSKALVSPGPITRSRAPPPLPENKELSKASQEEVLRRHILLENEKKKYNMAVTETGETILYCVYSTLYS